jgi:hypothetical protein
MYNIRFSIPNQICKLALLTLLLGITASSFANEKNCWAEFFQASQYGGTHFRLEGPIQLKNLHNINGENWESRIDSLKVGAKATVTVFENINFELAATGIQKNPELLHSLGLTEKDALESSELIFHPNFKIHDLSDFNFRNKIKSLKIECLN